MSDSPDVAELEKYNRQAPCEHPEERLYDGIWFVGYSECHAVRCGRCKQFVDFGTLARRSALTSGDTGKETT